MTPLRIEICNERFVPRFGVDRFLVLLAQHLARRGHVVSFACLRCDPAMLRSISSHLDVLDVTSGLDMAECEAGVASLITKRWQHDRPDVVVIGGWPFFEAAVRARALGMKAIFIDAGAVAQDGLAESALHIQQELRRIRQTTLPSIDRILPISDFIRHTQSEPDHGITKGIRTVLLGADHMRLGTFSGIEPNNKLFSDLDARVQRGEKLLLCLGRFEPRGYKNSPAAYELLRDVQKHVPATRLLLLDGGHECNTPRDLRDSVILLGTPDDRTLDEIMKHCDAGVSVSLWEGFNLPLAEMQWLGRPAFALNIGAHPEIVVHPWLLSATVQEMAGKVVAYLAGKNVPELGAGFTRFRERRSWDSTLSAWEQEIVSLASEGRQADSTREARRVVLVDVSNSSRDPANPGVIRVARRLSALLQHYPQLEPVFATWNTNAQDYEFLDGLGRKFLQSFGGPSDGLGLLAQYRPDCSVDLFIASLSLNHSLGPVLFMPETMLDGQASARIEWAHSRGMKTAAVLFDLIPVSHSEFCDPKVTRTFPNYLTALARADTIWTISQFTLKEFERYAAQNALIIPPTCEAVVLPGQFGQQPRAVAAPVSDDETRILCVSTLEPRKNQLRLLSAFNALRKKRPGLPLHLTFVGNRYAAAPDIAAEVESACQHDAHIRWCGILDDAKLGEEYSRAAFTVYPSLVEGFGLPILESIWMGRPCLTHHDGVMQELASGGGCVTVDMSNVENIMQALERMATDPAFLEHLTQEAVGRSVTSWQEYAEEIGNRLLNL